MIDSGELILIVDDEPDMCWALEHLLNKRGYATHKALTALAALELMEQHRFAWAFLDAKLPDMDGLELARRIREKAPDMRLLMVSGYFYRDDVSIQEAIAQGVIIDLISKPFPQADILRVLET
jgi:CheY-like chemotaxis protein